MISIIVSTYREFYYSQLCESIKATIGDIPYGMIKIENHGELSITQAYNKGASQAQYPILCFVHEDVIFKTDNWGQLVCDYFFDREDNLGALGVAGGIKTQLVTGWGSGISGWDHMHIYHGGNLIHSNPNCPAEVNVLDGVIIFTPKKVWNEIRFDESITGFHFYDIDYTYRVSLKYKILVINSLLINHFSSGNFGKDWVCAAIEYHRKKKRIFEKASATDISQIRKFYYCFTQPGMFQMDFYYRLRYVVALGIDIRSLKFAWKFLFIKILLSIERKSKRIKNIFR